MKQILTTEEQNFVTDKIMPHFGIHKVLFRFDGSKKSYPDLWVDMSKSIPVVSVTAEWRRQPFKERMKRIVHEFIHLTGQEHDEKIGYNSIPGKDIYSMFVYEAIVGKQSNPAPKVTQGTEAIDRAFDSYKYRGDYRALSKVLSENLVEAQRIAKMSQDFLRRRGIKELYRGGGRAGVSYSYYKGAARRYFGEPIETLPLTSEILERVQIVEGFAGSGTRNVEEYEVILRPALPKAEAVPETAVPEAVIPVPEVTVPKAVIRYKRSYGAGRSVYFVEYEYGGERYITGTVVRGTDRSLGWYFGKGIEGLKQANRIVLLPDEEFSEVEDDPKYSWAKTKKAVIPKAEMPEAIPKKVTPAPEVTKPDLIQQEVNRLAEIQKSPEYKKLQAEWQNAWKKYGLHAKETLALRDKLLSLTTARIVKVPNPKNYVMKDFAFKTIAVYYDDGTNKIDLKVFDLRDMNNANNYARNLAMKHDAQVYSRIVEMDNPRKSHDWIPLPYDFPDRYLRTRYEKKLNENYIPTRRFIKVTDGTYGLLIPKDKTYLAHLLVKEFEYATVNPKKPHTEVVMTRIPKCNFCDKPAYADGKTVMMGHWAYMCKMHFAEYGVGLGLGKGQKLILKKNPLLENVITGLGFGVGFEVVDLVSRKLRLKK